MQRKLNQLVKIANELNEEAVRRYGPTASLFYESEGGFYIMTDDGDLPGNERQKFIVMSSAGVCNMGAGAW